MPDKEKNKSFVIDDDKVSVYGVREAYKTFDDIKPERTGTITAIKDGYPTTFYDSTMFELTKTDEKGNTVYLINGTTAKLTFQTSLFYFRTQGG